MRKKLLEQLPLTQATIEHQHATELMAMSDLLDQLPEGWHALRRISPGSLQDLSRISPGSLQDLSWRAARRVDPTKGRHGMAAELVLRAGVLKQHTGVSVVSYEGLAFGLADSTTCRALCRLGFDGTVFTKSSLQKNVTSLQKNVTSLQKNVKRVTAEEDSAVQFSSRRL